MAEASTTTPKSGGPQPQNFRPRTGPGKEPKKIIPNVTKVNGDLLVYSIAAGDKAMYSKEASILYPNSEIDIWVGEKLEGVYDSVFLNFDGHKYKVISRQNKTLITVNLKQNEGLIGNLNDGQIIRVGLESSKREEVSGTVEFKFTFAHETPEEEKARKEKEKLEEEKGKEGNSTSGPTAMIMKAMDDTLGGITGAISQNLSGGATTTGKGPTTSGTVNGNISESKKTENNQAAQDYDDSFDSSEQQTTKLAQPTTVQQAAELIGEYIDKNPEVIVNQQVRTEVLSALGGGGSEQVVSERLQNLSVEGRAALQTSVTSRISSQGGSVGEQLKTALNIVGRQVSSTSVSGGGGVSATGQIKTSVEVTGNQPAGAQGGSVSTRSEGQATISASVSAQAASGDNQGEPSQQASPQNLNLNLKQSAEIVGEFLDKNPGTVPNSQTRGNLLSALQSGNMAGLGTPEKAALESVAKSIGAQPDGRSAGRLKSASNIVVQAAGATPSPVGQQTEPKPVSEGSNQESNLSGQPLIEPLVGKGKVDGIENQEPGQGSDGQTAESEAPPAQKNLAEKIPSPNEGIDGAKPAMPAGMKGMQDNKNFLGNKLNLPQDPGQGSAKPVSGAGSQPTADLPQPAKKSEIPDGAAREGRPSDTAPLDEQTHGGEPLDKSQQPPGQAPLTQTPPAQSEPAQKDARHPEQDAEAAEQEKNQQEDPDAGSELPGQSPPQGSPAKKKEALDEQTKEAAVLANTFINDLLLDAALWIWVFAIPTFGLTLLVGAIGGDFLWLFKNSLLNSAVKRVKSPLLKGDLLQNEIENIKDKIKFNGLVKLNVVLMNLAVVIILLLVLIFIFAILKGLCDNWVTGAAAYVAGLGDVCKAVG